MAAGASLVDETQRFDPLPELLEAEKSCRRLSGRGNDEARPVQLQTGVFASRPYRGSASVRCGEGYYFGEAAATVGLQSAIGASFLSVRIQVPQIAGVDFGLNRVDSTTLRHDEQVEVHLNGWIETVSCQVERILTAAFDARVLPVRPTASPTNEGSADWDGRLRTTVEQDFYIWRLNVDVTCLSYAGNLFDQALLTALLAVMDLKLPQHLTWDTQRRWWSKPANETPGAESQHFQSPVAHQLSLFKYIPLPVTWCLVGESKLVDPDSVEAKGSPYPSATLVHCIPVQSINRKTTKLPTAEVFYDSVALPANDRTVHLEAFNETITMCHNAAQQTFTQILFLLRREKQESSQC